MIAAVTFIGAIEVLHVLWVGFFHLIEICSASSMYYTIHSDPAKPQLGDTN